MIPGCARAHGGFSEIFLVRSQEEVGALQVVRRGGDDPPTPVESRQRTTRRTARPTSSSPGRPRRGV